MSHTHPLWLDLCVDILDSAPALARKLWQALASDASQEAQALQRSLDDLRRVSGLNPASLRLALQRWLQGAGSPQALIALLERYVERGTLRRRDVRGLEERILTRTGRDGQWQ